MGVAVNIMRLLLCCCIKICAPAHPRRRLYFGESNVEGMLATLLPLHEMMHKQGPTTLKEIAFVQVPGWA